MMRLPGPRDGGGDGTIPRDVGNSGLAHPAQRPLLRLEFPASGHKLPELKTFSKVSPPSRSRRKLSNILTMIA